MRSCRPETPRRSRQGCLSGPPPIPCRDGTRKRRRRLPSSVRPSWEWRRGRAQLPPRSCP
ncbi:hypothetical protein DB347_23140 [Opitutaceae bacterium EW11]|nr:hypothetical protein DB347_23140 [Opitutaceae bacterium EW11]